MDPITDKVIFAANDSHGRELLLAMLRDGHWAIFINQQIQPKRWPYHELAAATKAFRELVFIPSHAQPKPSPLPS